MRNRELFSFLRALRGLDVLGAAVVEYSPDYDPCQATALTAAQAAYEIMALALDRVQLPAQCKGGQLLEQTILPRHLIFIIH